MARRIDSGFGHFFRPGVLVADGIASNRLVLCSLLENAGCRVDPVGNGGDALSALESSAYDLAVLDLALPDLGGLSVVRRIRTLPEPRCGVPVLAISANPADAGWWACLAAGADECLTKPFRCADLWAAVSRLLAGSGDEDGQAGAGLPAGAAIAPMLDAGILARLGGDLGPETLAGILGTFTRDVDIRLHRIAAAAASANLRELAFESHAVSGCCRQLGAMRLAQLCGTLESAALNGDCDRALRLASAIGAVGADTLCVLTGHGAAA